MKRDMELCRKLLLWVRDECRPMEFRQPNQILISGHDANTIAEHLKRLAEAELLDLVRHRDTGIAGRPKKAVPPEMWQIRGLTWKGHDYVDAFSEQDIWKDALSSAGRYGLDVMFLVARKAIEKKLGIELPDLKS